MALRINNNISSLSAQRSLARTSADLGRSMNRLASGLRIQTAADDPAGLAISERMRSQVRALDQAARNTQDGISLTQTADGALSEASSLLGRMRELAVQAANGTLSVSDRAVLDTEFQELSEEIGRIADTTEFNGVSLLDGAVSSVAIQGGIDSGQTLDVPLADTTTTNLAIDVLDVTDATSASAAMAALDTAIESVSDARGSFGASQNVMTHHHSVVQETSINLRAAQSRIRDVDVALETAKIVQKRIIQQLGTSVLAQANTSSSRALDLLART